MLDEDYDGLEWVEEVPCEDWEDEELREGEAPEGAVAQAGDVAAPGEGDAEADVSEEDVHTEGGGAEAGEVVEDEGVSAQRAGAGGGQPGEVAEERGGGGEAAAGKVPLLVPDIFSPASYLN